MADKLPPVPEGGFKDGNTFQDWLKSLPDSKIVPFGQVLSCRAAFRSLPYLSVSSLPLTIAALRAASTSRVAIRYPTSEIAEAASLARRNVDAAGSTNNLAAHSIYHATESATFAAEGRSEHPKGPATSLTRISTSLSVARSSDTADILVEDSAKHSAESHLQAAHSGGSEIWSAVKADAEHLLSGVPPLEILGSPLWPYDQVPLWWVGSRQRFQARLELQDREDKRKTDASGNWSKWSQWYFAVAQGRPPWGLPSAAAWELEKRIALGNGRGEMFWSQQPEEINDEIAVWIEEARKKQHTSKGPVFISYTANDEAETMRIGTIIEDIGFAVFAQYKDMPPGSNFITEMNRGLDRMGKFVPILSPDYVASQACEAEWNAAFNMDRNGERRLIIGFMLRPATLPPLYRQVVHVPLYNLTESQLRDAVRDALIWDGKRYGPVQSREIAAEAALPAATINTQGQIDVEESPLEAPFIDDDLARLPESMRRHIETLLAALEGSNCSKLLTGSLKNYLLELTVHGATPNLPDLNRAADIIENARLDAKDEGEGWYKRSSKTAFDQFATMHEQLRQHFPLIMLRDISIERTSIEADRFDDEAFANAHKVLTKAATEAHQAGAMSDNFYAVMELRERQRRDIESLRAKPQPDPETVFLHPADRRTPEDIKKRFLFDVSGSSDELLSKTAQASQIADSDAIKGLIKAAGDLLKNIWG